MLFNNYVPRNILVTGGAGFIGANFIRYYLEHYPEARIINLDLLTYAGSLDNLENCPHSSRHVFIQGDISDAAMVKNVLNNYNIDTIVHFAAESHVDRSIHGPAAFVQTNVVGTFTLLEAARSYWLHDKKWTHEQCRFHHISTDEVYGTLSKDEPGFSETTPYAPNSPYSASKAGSDHLVRAYFHTYQLPVTISNCSNNYGPYQHAEKFVPTVIRSCLEWKPIPVYGDGSNIRDWLYVEDHCRGIAKIIANGRLGEAYNLGGQHEMDNLTLVRRICDKFDKLLPREKPYYSLVQFVKDRPGHDWRYAIDISKATSELAWQPLINFDHGLTKTIRHYGQAGSSIHLSVLEI